jgi:hypothetical protein
VEAATFSVMAKMGEEGCDFWNAHVLRVAIVVEKDEAANPLNVGLFCTVECLRRMAPRTHSSNFLGGVDGIFMKARIKN